MQIALDGLSHRYGSDGEPVIDRLSHVFEPGAVTAITGPSGSGKSTILYIAALLLTPTDGHVLWDDTDVGALSDGQRSWLRAQHLGFVFQDAVLDPAQSALDNVLEAAWLAGMPRADAQLRARTLMQRFGVADRATHLPGQLSGGQAQRFGLCRALLKSPAVVFADEPTGNLDTDSADTVWQAFRAAAEDGITVIVATHDRRRAESCDRHLELE